RIICSHKEIPAVFPEKRANPCKKKLVPEPAKIPVTTAKKNQRINVASITIGSR
ncbi:MAG: hypothetical protein K0R75_3188, partial [Paenibacillaceae bacterium]|nr:hypothetical protein [Paenibacillaceae bacterium]